MSDTDVDEDEGEVVDEEGAEGGDEEGGGGRRLSTKKLALFIGLPLLLIIGSGAGAYFGGALDSLFESGAPSEQAEGEQAAPLRAEDVVFFDLPEMLVNLNSGTEQAGLLKVKVSLELTDPANLEKLQALQPRVIDHFQEGLIPLTPV